MTIPEESQAEPTSSDWAQRVGSQRDDQYTPMGEISMFGDFAMGARRARGWRRWLSLALVLLILSSLILGVVWGLADVLAMRT